MIMTTARPASIFRFLARAAVLAVPLLACVLASDVYAQGRSYSVFNERDEARGARGAAPSQALSRRQRLCQYYERQLAASWVQGRRPDYELAPLREKISKADARYNALRAQADRYKCYTSFLIFGTQLRNTRRCHRIDRQLKAAERLLERLQRRRQAILRPRSDSGRRAQIIQKLAENRCGPQYQREARRNSFFWWGDDDSYDRGDRQAYGADISPYATYRTMCVRLCDGYYFPISFSTLSSRFPQDEIICQNKCAAPAQLFIYRNPGEDVEQMVSWEGGVSYQSLENAFLYRKKFVKGCSCKASEYLAENDRPDDGKVQGGQNAQPVQEATGAQAPGPRKDLSSAPATASEQLAHSAPPAAEKP